MAVAAAPKRRYWDSNVFLAWIKGESGRVEICEAIVRLARNDECVIVTSAITLAEVVRPRQKGTIEMTEDEDKKIVAFFSNPFLRFVDLSPSLAARSRVLQWKFNLGVRDAIHVVSAIAGRADVIETYDPDFTKVDVSLVADCPPIRQPLTKPLPLFPEDPKP
jgi:predicted nucleic acid-binding protein